MTKEAGTSGRNGKELQSQSRARYLTPHELVARAKGDLAGLLGIRKLKTVDRFISEKVTGIHLNNVDVLSIDVDHTTEIDSYIKAYMQSPRTALIISEFFYPELIENAGILARPMRKVKQRGGTMYGARLQAAERVEQALREAGKPVAVADIADRGSYLAWNYILRLSPVFLGGAIALATKQDLAAFAGAKPVPISNCTKLKLAFLLLEMVPDTIIKTVPELVGVIEPARPIITAVVLLVPVIALVIIFSEEAFAPPRMVLAPALLILIFCGKRCSGAVHKRTKRRHSM